VQQPWWAWAGFLTFIAFMLALDLGVLRRKVHVIRVREAMTWTAIWVSLALTFNVIIYFWLGREPALEFLAGYLIEYSLSVDNIFVFVLIFKYFNTPQTQLHRVLVWGILGAVVLRAIFILVGIGLIAKFHWIIYVFGVILVVSGFKLFFEQEKEFDPEKNPLMRIMRKFLRISNEYDGNHFFVRKQGLLTATPLFVVLVIIETTDVVFAVDSIPAILAVTKNPFIVFTSNIFAILGLRSLFFALQGMMGMFRYLHYGLGGILVFVGVKMLITDFYKIPIVWSLTVIGSILALSLITSLIWAREKPTSNHDTPA